MSRRPESHRVRAARGDRDDEHDAGLLRARYLVRRHGSDAARDRGAAAAEPASTPIERGERGLLGY
ncbi:MAG: hypothetical protein BroJett022_24980 [Actinomycetes bacterium]|nr:MAG: hypothetical protein BroJett022_24980 [Actinomycetes bacterium]